MRRERETERKRERERERERTDIVIKTFFTNPSEQYFRKLELPCKLSLVSILLAVTPLFFQLFFFIGMSLQKNRLEKEEREREREGGRGHSTPAYIGSPRSSISVR